MKSALQSLFLPQSTPTEGVQEFVPHVSHTFQICYSKIIRLFPRQSN